jgi:carboxypeptidase C (cathepsin A)
MRYLRNGIIVFITCVGASAWGQGQGRGRGAAAQQSGAQTGAQPPAAQAAQQPGAAAAPAQAGGRGGRGAPAAPATSEFYDFETSAGGEPPFPEGPPSETHQKITANGETLAYTTRAGYMPLRNVTTGQSEAHIFYTSYSKDGVSDASRRPVVMFFGGAPGVSAAWQDFGGLGPKRMKYAADGSAGSAPYVWSDNPDTLLTQADLVFVNPVGTALSRPDQPSHAPNFWNSQADVASLAAFVRGYLAANDRRNSPLFLAGEDASTGRAAGIAAYLIEHGTPVQGVALLSMTESPDASAGDAQYMTLLPSLVMTAWHHKKLSPEMNKMSAEEIAGQARQFASREYLHALYKGDRMTADERAKALADLSRLTGLSKQFLVSNEMRVTLDRFNTELLRDQRRGVSYSDSRVTGFIPAAGGGGRGGGGFGGFVMSPIDFNLSNLTGGFQTAYEEYLHRELTFNAPPSAIFYLSSGGIGTFTSTGNDDSSLSGAFARSPNMHLFVAVNFYDLHSPFYATEFTLAHLNVSPEVRAHNITVSHYEAGEMTYVDNKAAGKLKSDLASFINQSVSPEPK